MKCEKCGAEISDGNLYCEKCGEEIHIVPYFEPEVETQIDESMHRISDDVIEQTIEHAPRRRKRKHHYLVWLIILVIFSMIAGIIALTYLYNSPLYQVNRGNWFANNGEYKEAIECYEIALEKNAENPVEIYLYMIKCYEVLGYDGQYEEYLLRVIASEQATEIQELMAYTKLITLYSEGNSYQTINNLLKNCKNDKIVEIYKSFMVSSPRFSHKEGTYNEIIPLKISSPDGDMVYYTLDGSVPTMESIVYEEPVFLDDGFYEFRAICVDEHGVASDMVVMKYQVNFATR